MKKLFYGVGTNSGGKYKTWSNGKRPKSYALWCSMLQRTYCPKGRVRQPTYLGCSVAEEWLEYQTFAEWFSNHEYSDYGYHLDKDLLITGNKIYAPSTVCFVPQQLNKLLNGSGATRGQYLQGVCFHKRVNKFLACIAINGKRKNLGYFDTELEAYYAYKKAKEQYVKASANHWRDDIADEVYHALMNWDLKS